MPTKQAQNDYVMEPTPKVQPYDIDESCGGQLRMLPGPNGFIASPKECLSSSLRKERLPTHTLESIESELKGTKKVDRSESIRRAEEMLSQFLKDQVTSKRPEFLKNRIGNAIAKKAAEEIEAEFNSTM